MSGVEPAGQRCALPTPAKWVGGIISLAALVGFGTAAYLGKLDRKVALLGAGLSGVSLVVFGAIPRKVVNEESVVEKKTLRFTEDLDTLEKLLEAINGVEDLEVLDLTQLPNDPNYSEEGKLLLAIAKHPTLKRVVWGENLVGLWSVDGWEMGLKAVAKGEEIPPYLDAYLSRTNAVCIPHLQDGSELLEKLAERENLEWIRMQKNDRDALVTSVLSKIDDDSEFEPSEIAFLKLLEQIDKVRWDLNDQYWSDEELLRLLNACGGLRKIELGDVEDIWTAEVATALQGLIDRGCKVECEVAHDLMVKSRKTPADPRFKVALALCDHLTPENDWTTDELLASIPQVPNLEGIDVDPNTIGLVTPAVVEKLKAQGITIIALRQPTIDSLKVFQGLALEELVLLDADQLDEEALKWIVQELAPDYIHLEGEWPPAISLSDGKPNMSSQTLRDAYPKYRNLDSTKKQITLLKKSE